MKFSIRIIFILSILVLPIIVHAQQILTLKNAIDSALLYNYDIKVAENEAAIAKMNNTNAIAGGLPIITANAGENVSLSAINQEFTNSTLNYTGNKAENTLNAGIGASMTLYNGLKVIATKEKLNRLQNLSEIQLNQQIQNLIGDITVSYFDIVRQQKYLKIIERLHEVSQKKLEIVTLKRELGMADSSAILQAQSDLNSTQQQISMQSLAIEQAKSDLLLYIHSSSNLNYTVNQEINVDSTMQFEKIMSFINQNPQLQSAEQQIFINEQIVKEISSQRYPSIKLNAGYDFYQNNASNSSLIMNRNYGPAAGISVQVPIYNGNIYKTQKEIATIRVENSKLELEKTSYSIKNKASQLYKTYIVTLQQIDLQRNNYLTNQKLVELVLLQFQLGKATILEVKAAQSSFESSAYLLVNLQYAAKVAETELKKLTFDLRP